MEKYKGFILYPTYRVRDDKAYIYLIGKLDSGKTFCTISEFRPYFFIKKKDLVKAKGIAMFAEEDVSLLTMKQEPVVKISVSVPQEVPGIRKLFENASIPCYEADIRFSYRFMIDHLLQGSVTIEGVPRPPLPEYEFVDLVFENPKLTPSDHSTELKVLSLDIETNMKDNSIYSIALNDGAYHNVLLLKNKTHPEKIANAEFVENEEELLKKFIEIFQKIDPDLVTGWNVIDFDFAIIRDACKKYKIPFFLGRLKGESSLRITEDYFQDSTADFSGRQVLDGIHLLKTSFVKLDDYKLGTAAKHFLKEEKLIGDENKGSDIDDAYLNNPQMLVDYNLKDTQLVLDILKKSGVLDLTILRSKMTGMPLERVRGSIASLDSLYLKALRKKGYVAPSLSHAVKENQITGGFVRKSMPGIYDNVLVLDFKSLYPSVMRTFNIDPLSFVEDISRENDFSKLVKSPNGAYFRNDSGILPKLLEELWQRRDQAKKRKNDLDSFAIKILMNSFFGVLASPNCRFFSLQMANAITHFGQHFIKMIAERLEKQGLEVIYGDTDSIFVHAKMDDFHSADLLGKKIEKEVNIFLKDHITKEYHRESFLELEYEKLFVRFLMPMQRGSLEGSKKRYAGLKLIGEKNGEPETKLDFVGLEFVRRDWTELAKKFQLGLLDRIFHKQEVATFIKEFVSDVKAGKMDDLLVYRKAIRKDLESYTKTTPPHVKAARMLDKVTSNIIEYVMTSDGPQPLSMRTASIDYQHYLDKQVKPLAESVLCFFNQTFDDVISSSNQKKLFDF